MSLVAIPCYHRILDEGVDPQTDAYLLRGSGLGEGAFRAQVADLVARFDPLGQDDALDRLRHGQQHGRPGVWFTFDDAYVDVIERALPVLDAHGAVATVFVSSQVLDGKALPVDRWYAAVSSARARRGVLDWVERWVFDLDDPAALRRLVDGPEKRLFVRSPPALQEDLLTRLASTLDAATTEPPEGTYLRETDLRDLVRRGWSIGNHGHRHALLSKLSAEDATSELVLANERIAAVVGMRPRTLAYPDGASNRAVVELARQLGFEGALGLERGFADHLSDRRLLPRLLPTQAAEWARNLRPTGDSTCAMRSSSPA